MARLSDDDRLQKAREEAARAQARVQAMEAKAAEKKKAEEKRKAIVVGELILKHDPDLAKRLVSEHCKNKDIRTLFGVE